METRLSRMTGCVRTRRVAPSVLRRMGPSGIVLLETLVALTILAVAVLALVRAAAANVRTTAEARDRSIAAGLAELKLAEVTVSPDRFAADVAGGFGEDYTTFSWRSHADTTPWPELRRVSVTIAWGRQPTSRELTIETFVRPGADLSSTRTRRTSAAGPRPEEH